MTRDVPTRPILACLGAVVAVLVAAVAAILVAYGRGYYDGGYRVTAVFPASAQGLFTDGGSEVKMRGITIGTVAGIELLPDGGARFRLLLERDAQVPESASASIEPLSLFGPKFIQLSPGDGEGDGPYLEPGDEITDTSISPELTRLLDRATSLLSTIEPDEVASIFVAVSEGVDGLGEEIGASIDAASHLVEVAHANNDLTRTFLGDLAVVSTTFASRSASFVSSIDDLRALAAVTSEHRGDLPQLLDTARAVAASGGGLLELTAEDFDLTVRSIASVVGAVYEERDRVPDTLDAVGAFFKMLADPMRLPGPDGTTLTALKGFITVDLCLVFGICVVPGGTIGSPAAAAVLPAVERPPGAPSPQRSEADRSGLGALADLLLSPLGGGAR